MSETIQIIGLVLAALFIGILVPVLFSIRSTIVQLKKLLDKTQQPAIELIYSANRSAKRVDEVLEMVEDKKEAIGNLVERLEDFSGTVQNVSRTLKASIAVGAAVGPAVAAFVQTWKETHAAEYADDTFEGADGRTEASHAPDDAMYAKDSYPQDSNGGGADGKSDQHGFIA